ncbi:MAG: hypothetical protein ACKOEO_12045 [Planctomycetaceae bacterium]
METRRILTFTTCAIIYLLVWSYFFPPPAPPEKPQDPAAAIADTDPAGTDPATSQTSTDGSPSVAAASGTDDNGGQTPVDPAQPVIPDHPAVTTTLGSTGPVSGFALEVVLTSAGASVESVSLAPPAIPRPRRQNPAGQGCRQQPNSRSLPRHRHRIHRQTAQTRRAIT